MYDEGEGRMNQKGNGEAGVQQEAIIAVPMFQ